MILIDPKKFADNQYFFLLGRDGNRYYYLSKNETSVNLCSIIGFTTLDDFLKVAPMKFWKKVLSDKGFEPKFVNANLTVLQDEIYSQYRGRRFSLDYSVKITQGWEKEPHHEYKFIVHSGEKIYCGKKVFSLNNHPFNTSEKFFLPSNGPSVDYSDPTKQPDSGFAKKVLRAIETISFENDRDRILLAGWMVLAPMSGILERRPSGWLLGDSNTGKTYLIDNFIKPLLGSSVLSKQMSKVNRTFLTKNLSSHYTGCIIDRGRNSNKVTKSSVRLKSVLSVAKSSLDDSIEVGKAGAGTSSGIVQIIIKSCFLFSSVNRIELGTNESHVVNITLSKGLDDEAKRKEYYRKVINSLSFVKKDKIEASRKFHHWIYKNTDNISSNINTAKRVLADDGLWDDGRRECLGALLGAFITLKYQGKANLKEVNQEAKLIKPYFEEGK